MLTVHKVDTGDPRDVERFIQFPFHLYRDCPEWVPPVVSSARKQLNREIHPFYTHSDADFFLALDGERVSGRIAVLEPRKRNRYKGRQGAFFCLFEATEDIEVARALFGAAFEWAQQRDLEEISGPEGFLPGDSLGILVKGFDHRPAMGITYNLAYYDEFVQDSGFEKQTDYNSCYLPGDLEFPERFIRVVERVKERRGFQVLEFRNKAEVREAAPRVVDAYNAAFSENREFIPIAGEDAKKIADRIIDMTQPDLVKAVTKGDEIAGFALGFPDVSAALQRCKGRLYPFGWAMLMWEARRTNWINFNGAGILPKYQGLGVNAILYHEMYKAVQRRGFDHADLAQVNEQNPRMVQELEALGADLYKKHRIYQRAL